MLKIQIGKRSRAINIADYVPTLWVEQYLRIFYKM